MATILIYEIDDSSYKSDGGAMVRREYGKTPVGNDVAGRWVYRDRDGKWIDCDQFRNDLFERNGIVVGYARVHTPEGYKQ